MNSELARRLRASESSSTRLRVRRGCCIGAWGGLALICSCLPELTRRVSDLHAHETGDAEPAPGAGGSNGQLGNDGGSDVLPTTRDATDHPEPGDDAGPRDAGPEPTLDAGPDAAPLPPPAVGWAAISVGGDYACGLTTQKRVMCWGSLQGGDGSSAAYVPVEVPGLSDVSKIMTSQVAACAVLGDGTASCWGAFEPDGSGTSALPKPVTQLFNLRSLMTTLEKACGLLGTGMVSCFDGVTLTPRALFDLGTATAIDSTLASADHYCAVTQVGGIACWGGDTFMQLSNPGVIFPDWLQVVPIPDVQAATQVAVADSHVCALANGEVICWGDNSLGQMGLGYVSDATAAYFRPTQVPGLPRAVAIDAGAALTCAVLEDQTLRCWGLLGQNPIPTPVQIPGLSGVVSVSVGSNSSCVVEQDGTAWCFGDNTSGQLGNPIAADSLGQAEDYLGPVRVLGPERPAPGTN